MIQASLLVLVCSFAVVSVTVAGSSATSSPTPCTVARDCSNHALSVSGNSVTGCMCVCRNQWEGSTCSMCPRRYDVNKDCGACASGNYDYPYCHPATTAVPAPLPPAPARAMCVSVVKKYWARLASGNFSGAMELVHDNATFNWPGDQSVLPMAGTWTGPNGIAAFFNMIATFFNFKVCRAPWIVEAGGNAAYANWLECSTLVGTNSYVPCPNLLNQALYTCDAAGQRIVRIDVNLDNSCVASAICQSSNATLACTARQP